MRRMRAVFFAYHAMGIVGLKGLLAHGFEVPMVFSHEDDPGEDLFLVVAD